MSHCTSGALRTALAPAHPPPSSQTARLCGRSRSMDSTVKSIASPPRRSNGAGLQRREGGAEERANQRMAPCKHAQTIRVAPALTLLCPLPSDQPTPPLAIATHSQSPSLSMSSPSRAPTFQFRPAQPVSSSPQRDSAVPEAAATPAAPAAAAAASPQSSTATGAAGDVTSVATTLDFSGGAGSGSGGRGASISQGRTSPPSEVQHASSDTFTLMPFRAASPSSMQYGAPVSHATHSSSRVPSASVSGPQRPSSPSPSQQRFHSISSAATPSSRSNAASPFSSALSSGGGGIQSVNSTNNVNSSSKDESDRAPLLSQFDADDHAQASSLSAEALAKLHPLAAAAAAAGGGPAPVTNSSSVYDQYESTVHKIRARRAMELAAKEKAAAPSPEKTMHEFKVAGTFLAIVTLIVAMVIYFMYPRIPLWSIQKVEIQQMRLWRSDHSARRGQPLPPHCIDVHLRVCLLTCAFLFVSSQ